MKERGSEDVSLCLNLFFFAKNIDEHVTTVIGFSDACDCLIGNYNVARYMTFSVNTLKKNKQKNNCMMTV